MKRNMQNERVPLIGVRVGALQMQILRNRMDNTKHLVVTLPRPSVLLPKQDTLTLADGTLCSPRIHSSQQTERFPAQLLAKEGVVVQSEAGTRRKNQIM